MCHMAAKPSKEEPPEEDWWAEEEVAAAIEYCAKKVAGLPKGQKGRAYRECIRQTLGKEV